MPTTARSLRLFLIGNSFSQNATAYLPQLAQDGGYELTIGRAESPGAPLQWHWDGVMANDNDPNDPAGTPYDGKSLRELLSAGEWDIVTVQQASILSSRFASYSPYARQLRDFVMRLQPRAEVAMHQTWAYRCDSHDFGFIDEDRQARSEREMWEKLTVAYHSTAADLELRLIPTGEAFWRIQSHPRWGYRRDPDYNFVQPAFPSLPDQAHSLHAGYWWEGSQLQLDAHHANEAGMYLGSLVWYGFLFNESPEGVTFHPPQVPAPFAAALQRAAALALHFAVKGTSCG